MEIVVAEDEPITRTLLRRTLEKLGHGVRVATDGEAAWEMLSRQPADVLITDWMMPRLDGLELCRRLRRDDAGSYTYVVLLTGMAESAHVVEGMRAGADDYLTKPVEHDLLQARLVAAERITTLHCALRRRNEELARINAELFQQARHDPLTSLYNRLKLAEDLVRLREDAELDGMPRSLALCDIDRFKAFNDMYGHPCGDEALQSVACVLAQVRRIDGAAYRYGGEEFCLVLGTLAPQCVEREMERVRDSVVALQIPHRSNVPDGVLTLSSGVATFYPGDSRSTEEVLRDADTALYEAKQAGRNRVVLHAA